MSAQPSLVPGGTGRPGSEVRRRLLDTAISLIARDGFERINTNLVAKEAGLGVGTFYAHFKDKYALLRAVVLETAEGLGERLEAAARAAPPDDLAETVRAIVTANLEFAEARPDAYRAAFREAAGVHAGRAAAGVSTRAVERRLAALQAAGRLETELAPAVAARAFAAMERGVTIWWLDDPDGASREAVVETLVRLHPALAARMPR